MMSSGSIEVARGNLPWEHLFKLEEAKLLSVLGMPASSLAPEQLSRGSDLLRGIIRNSKLLTPTGISVAWTAQRTDKSELARRPTPAGRNSSTSSRLEKVLLWDAPPNNFNGF